MTTNKGLSQFDAPQTQKFEHDENLKAKRVINVDTVVGSYWNRIVTDNVDNITSASFYLDKENHTTTITVNTTNLQSKYFLLDDVLNVHNYYVWFNIDSGGTDPSLVGRTGLEVPLTASYDLSTIAQAIDIVLNISVPDYFDVEAYDNTVQIVNAEIGQSDGARDGTSGFNFVVDITGITQLLKTINLDAPTGYSYIYNEVSKEILLTADNTNRIDTGNSTSDPLAIGEVFYGPWTERSTSELIVAPFSDTDFTFYVQFANTQLSTTLGQPIYTAGTSGGIDSSLTYLYLAGEINVPRRLVISRQWYRIVAVNTSLSNQTSLRIQTSIGTFSPLASRLDASISTDADAEVIRSIIAGDTLDTSLVPTGVYNNVQLTSNQALKVNQVGEVIFQYIRPDDPQIPTGTIPTINQVLNNEPNVIDSGWLSVREFSTQNFHIIANQSCKVFLLNGSDGLGSNWNGFTDPALVVNANQPANLSARFFDDYFRIVLINDSGSIIDEITVRSVGSNNMVQPIDISLDQPVFDFFPAPLTQAVQKGANPNGTFTNQKLGGKVDVSTSTTPLGAGDTFSSGIYSCQGYTQISTGLKSDQAGTINGVWYADEAGTQPLRTFTVPYTPSSDISWFSSVVFSDYISISYTNGATPQTEFYLQTELDTNAKHGQMLSLEAFVPSNSLVNLNRVVLVGKKPDGVYENVRSNDAGALQTSEFLLDIAIGNYANYDIDTKFGRNPMIDAGTPESVWNGGGIYTGFPTTADTVDITSTSANDTSGGSGARTIIIEGLDVDFNPISETITLNGLTAVTSSNSYLRLNRAYVVTSGDSLVNEGDITIAHTATPTTIFIVISTGVGQSALSSSTVPAGKTRYILSLNVHLSRSNNQAGSGNILFRTKDGSIATSGWRSRRNMEVTNSSSYESTLKGAIVLPEKTDIDFYVLSVTANGTVVTAEYEYLDVDN